MKGADVEGLASARSARSVGCVMTKRRRRASSASALGELEQLLAHGVDGGQRRIEATQSSAVTGWPSCHQAYARSAYRSCRPRTRPIFPASAVAACCPVHGDQRVVDHVAVPGGDVGRGGVRVGQAQRRMHHRPERGLGRGGRCGGQRQQRQERRPARACPGWPRGPRDAGGTGRYRLARRSRWRMRAPSGLTARPANRCCKACDQRHAAHSGYARRV